MLRERIEPICPFCRRPRAEPAEPLCMATHGTIFGPLTEAEATTEIAAIIFEQDRRRVLSEGDAEFIARSVVHFLTHLDES